MNSLCVNQNIKYGISGTPQVATSPVTNNVIPPASPSERDNNMSFKGASVPAQVPVQTQPKPPLNLRTELTTNEEKTKYSQIYSVLDKNERQNLDVLLRKGILLNTNSNDKSSTLDNLYKIASTQRAVGLDAKNVLNETINTIANPFIIT